MHEFKKSIIIGSQGEDKVISYVTKDDMVFSFKDLRDDKAYQAIDIDFLIVYKAQKGVEEVFVDVKTDMQMSRTNNFFIETVSNVERLTKGWLYKSEADYIWYLDYHNNILYEFNLNKLREYVDNNTFREVSLKNLVGDSSYTTKGMLLPVSSINDLIISGIITDVTRI
jgi:hypothetical protein